MVTIIITIDTTTTTTTTPTTTTTTTTYINPILQESHMHHSNKCFELSDTIHTP